MYTLNPADSRGWVAAGMSLAGVDPLSAARGLGLPTVFWERPSTGEAVAGWGEAGTAVAASAKELPALLKSLADTERIHWLDEQAEGPPGPWFGGARFAAAAGEVDRRWSAFGHSRWVLPEVLIWRVPQGLRAAAFTRDVDGAQDALRELLGRVREHCAPGRVGSRGGQGALRFEDSPDSFSARVSLALEAIGRGGMEKVVLARAMDVRAGAAFDEVEVLARLRDQNPRCTTFLFRGADGSAFMGATPETLFRLKGSELRTEALAGSAEPGAHDELCRQDKELREHQAVVDGILASLSPLAESVTADSAPHLLQLNNVVHLRTGVRADLKAGVGAAEVLMALHPTPAVGGTPRDRALHFLVEHEGLDRGWYAGPVGWIGPRGADIGVAIRSAWVEGAQARLYVGAGIVAGSNPEAEWRETQLKSLAMRRSLGGGPDA